jgi:DNA-binding transcriptional regulator YdaS (Cro superfamily)
MNPIKRASDMLGSQKALAEAINVTPGFISQCLSGHRKMPVDRCREIVSLSKNQISLEELRPDLYGEAA